jgi:hypothetical protein
MSPRMGGRMVGGPVVNDDSILRTAWRLATLPMRMLLLALLWVFAPDGSPLRLIPLVAGLFLLSQLVELISKTAPG